MSWNKSNPNNRLTVANNNQKIIFLCEMQGQISDGNWENSRPMNHWVDWCNLDEKTVLVGESIGRNFRTQKTAYAFNNKELLDIVGQRIITKINLVNSGVLPEDVLFADHWLIPDNASDFEWIEREANLGNKYSSEKFAKLTALGIDLGILQEAEVGPYTMKDLRKDCKGLSLALKTANGVKY